MSSFIIYPAQPSFASDSFLSRILLTVHCGEFSELSFFLHVQIIGDFVERLYLAKLSGYLQRINDSLLLECRTCPSSFVLSFLILCSLEIPAILRSQLISAQ